MKLQKQILFLLHPTRIPNRTAVHCSVCPSDKNEIKLNEIKQHICCNFILIPANPESPDHQRHHPDSPWTIQSLSKTLFKVHSNQSCLLPPAYRSHARLSLPSLITPELPWTSQSLPDHFKQIRNYSWTPALFLTNHCLLATPYSFKPVRIINAITRYSVPTMGHSKLHEPSWSTIL